MLVKKIVGGGGREMWYLGVFGRTGRSHPTLASALDLFALLLTAIHRHSSANIYHHD